MFVAASKIYIAVIFCNSLLYSVHSFLNVHNSHQQNFTVTRSVDFTFFSECSTPVNKTGLCIQAQKCNLEYQKLNRTYIGQIECGPRNQNRRRPYVCCELGKILVTEESTTVLNNIIKNKFDYISETFNANVCGIQLSSRIMGGDQTQPGEFPWLARLMRVNKQGVSQFSCTAALISSKVVITAAHCIESPVLSQLGKLDVVHLGEHETECAFGKSDCLQNQKVINVSKLIVHPQYKPFSRNFENDIGLIILEEKVKFSHFISPICLLEEPYESLFFVVSGWGANEFEAVSRIKRKTSLMAFSWRNCFDKYATLNITISENQVCAGGVKNQDSCQGDSGGPLMVLKEGRWHAAGLVSFGRKCGSEGWPGVYTYIPNYIEWIKNEIKKIKSY